MSTQDDELLRRYREASEQESARPSAQVRSAVRAHAQRLAATTAAVPATTRAAANEARWKMSALATVAVVGLVGLLMLQFERETLEEQGIAMGQRPAEVPAPAAEQPPTPAPESRTTRSAPAALPAPLPDNARAPAHPPATPPAAHSTLAKAIAEPSVPRPPPSTSAAPFLLPQPHAHMAKRSAAQDSVMAEIRLGTPLPHALHEAARAGSTLQVESIIRQGTPVDTPDSEGRTALMLAAMNGHAATVGKLLALGASTTLVGGDGLSAAQLARQMGHLQLADQIDATR